MVQGSSRSVPFHIGSGPHPEKLRRAGSSPDAKFVLGLETWGYRRRGSVRKPLEKIENLRLSNARRKPIQLSPRLVDLDALNLRVQGKARRGSRSEDFYSYHGEIDATKPRRE